MRIIKNVSHPAYRVDVFISANRYVLQIESTFFTQLYKFPVAHFESPEHLVKHLNLEFWSQVSKVFSEMRSAARAFENPDRNSGQMEII